MTSTYKGARLEDLFNWQAANFMTQQINCTVRFGGLCLHQIPDLACPKQILSAFLSNQVRTRIGLTGNITSVLSILFFGTCGAACQICKEDPGVCLLCTSWVLSLFCARYILQLRQCHSSTEIARSTTSRWRESDLIGQDLGSMGGKEHYGKNKTHTPLTSFNSL